jgi:hypothetical protein
MVYRFAVKKLLPFILIYITLILAAIFLHLFLQGAGHKWILRYLGIAGTILIILSFVYSLRKRNLVKFGKAKLLLQIHEAMAWLGSLLILIHAGFEFGAVIPRMAVFAMLIVVASGLTGKYLLKQAKISLKEKRAELTAKKLPEDEIERKLFTLSLVADKMQMWRTVHIPLTLIFTAFAMLHIITILLFWQW